MATRVYVSGSLSELDELREYASRIGRFGYEVTSSWLYEPVVTSDDLDWLIRARAHDDMEDIERADLFLMSSVAPTHNGGRHTELGLALARRMPVHVVGPLTNTFMHLRTVTHWGNWSLLMSHLEHGGTFG